MLFQVNEEDDQLDPPQLSVKREFSIGKGGVVKAGARERNSSTVESEDEGEAGANNLLDCLVQVDKTFFFKSP